jgi:hypothetical protein
MMATVENCRVREGEIEVVRSAGPMEESLVRPAPRFCGAKVVSVPSLASTQGALPFCLRGYMNSTATGKKVQLRTRLMSGGR